MTHLGDCADWYALSMLTLVHGSDAALGDEQVARLVGAARAADPLAEVSSFDGDAVGLGELQSALTTFSLFSSTRIVIIVGLAVRFATDERLREDLTSLLAARPEGLHLIFREGRALGSHPLVQAVRAAGGEVIMCAPLSRQEFPVKLAEVARDLGLDITRPAVGLLAERCLAEVEVEGRKRVGYDLTKGRTELLKLATYAGAGKIIDEHAVKALVDAPLQQVFAFTEALAARHLARATAVLDQLLARGEVPQVIFANIVRQFRLLLIVAAGRQEGGDTTFLRTGEFHLRDFQLRTLERQAESFSLDRLRRIVGLLLRADEAIKSGRVDAEAAVRLLCASICTEVDLFPVMA